MTPEQKRERQRRVDEMLKKRERWLERRKESDKRLKDAIQTLRELSGRA